MKWWGGWRGCRGCTYFLITFMKCLLCAGVGVILTSSEVQAEEESDHFLGRLLCEVGV
jgi:hypothetical protein